LAVLTHLTEGPQILVGSSMGGWIALQLARAVPERVAGLVGIAAAPDFTEDSMWAGFSEAQKAALRDEGRIVIPSDYSPEGYPITRRLIEEGRARLVLRSPLRLPFPVRVLQGTADTDVPPSVALRLMDHAECDDLRVTLVKGADHRFSTPACLAMIAAAVEEAGGRFWPSSRRCLSCGSGCLERGWSGPSTFPKQTFRPIPRGGSPKGNLHFRTSGPVTANASSGPEWRG